MIISIYLSKTVYLACVSITMLIETVINVCCCFIRFGCHENGREGRFEFQLEQSASDECTLRQCCSKYNNIFQCVSAHRS